MPISIMDCTWITGMRKVRRLLWLQVPGAPDSSHVGILGVRAGRTNLEALCLVPIRSVTAYDVRAPSRSYAHDVAKVAPACCQGDQPRKRLRGVTLS